jgi:hypothetical protein
MARRTDKELTRAVLRVGDDRGLVVSLGGESVVITAAHCLPVLPTNHLGAASYERTYGALLGSLHAKPKIAAECLFVDPITDIAVLGAPDADMEDESGAYYKCWRARSHWQSLPRLKAACA